MRDRSIYWRCFHCGDAFTKSQERHARDHFGATCSETPVCIMRVPGEYELLRALRSAQDELARYRGEDTDLLRAIHGMAADHARALRREEERGYERGLRDGQNVPPTSGNGYSRGETT
jgi:Na+-translocating ferredoxin:NAD+ oxidoreductase RnfC subunit